MRILLMVGVQSIGSVTAAAENLSWSMESKVMACLGHLRGRDRGSPGLRGPRTAGLYAYVGLLGYEDTR